MSTYLLRLLYVIAKEERTFEIPVHQNRLLRGVYTEQSERARNDT